MPVCIRTSWLRSLVWIALTVGTAAACASTDESIAADSVTTVVASPIDAAAPLVDDEYLGTGPTVSVIGDSIIAESLDDIRDALSAFRVRIASRVGGTIDALIPAGQEYAKTNPEVVVVNLGTNDVWWRLPVEEAVADFQAIVDLFPESCTVAVTVTEHGDPGWRPYRPIYDQALATAFNAAIRPRVDHVADWEAAIASDPGRFTGGDLIHPTEEGQELLGQLIERAVSECDI